MQFWGAASNHLNKKDEFWKQEGCEILASSYYCLEIKLDPCWFTHSKKCSIRPCHTCKVFELQQNKKQEVLGLGCVVGLEQAHLSYPVEMGQGVFVWIHSASWRFSLINVNPGGFFFIVGCHFYILSSVLSAECVRKYAQLGKICFSPCFS